MRQITLPEADRIDEVLAGKPADERHDYQRQIIRAALGPLCPLAINQAGIRATVNWVQIQQRRGREVLVMEVVDASMGGTPVRISNPVIFTSPPLKVPSGNTVFSHVGEDGERVFKPMFLPNPRQAIAEVVIDLVRIVSKL